MDTTQVKLLEGLSLRPNHLRLLDPGQRRCIDVGRFGFTTSLHSPWSTTTGLCRHPFSQICGALVQCKFQDTQNLSLFHRVSCHEIWVHQVVLLLHNFCTIFIYTLMQYPSSPLLLEKNKKMSMHDGYHITMQIKIV